MHVVVRPLYYEDIQVGDSYRSPGRTVTEADVAAFAGLSGDLTELHPNAAAMREHVYGVRIAHGLPGLAIQSGLATRVVPPSHIVGFAGITNWRFEVPIFLGDKNHLEITVSAKRRSKSRPDRGIVSYARRLINQDNRVVQPGATANIVLLAPPDAKPEESPGTGRDA
jgi:acyl dehydratase